MLDYLRAVLGLRALIMAASSSSASASPHHHQHGGMVDAGHKLEAVLCGLGPRLVMSLLAAVSCTMPSNLLPDVVDTMAGLVQAVGVDVMNGCGGGEGRKGSMAGGGSTDARRCCLSVCLPGCVSVCGWCGPRWLQQAISSPLFPRSHVSDKAKTDFLR